MGRKEATMDASKKVHPSKFELEIPSFGQGKRHTHK